MVYEQIIKKLAEEIKPEERLNFLFKLKCAFWGEKRAELQEDKMSYLGLDLDNLCWEIKSLMQNNYDREVTKKNLNLLFTYAKNDILEIFKDIINQNKEEVLNDFKEHLESLEDD